LIENNPLPSPPLYVHITMLFSGRDGLVPSNGKAIQVQFEYLLLSPHRFFDNMFLNNARNTTFAELFFDL